MHAWPHAWRASLYPVFFCFFQPLGISSVTQSSSFDQLWQSLPQSPSVIEIYELLSAQLHSPSVALPVLHPHRPGAKAFAQLLFVPCHALGPDNAALGKALELLFSRGRIESIPSCDPFLVSEPNAFFLAQLVLRSDDPAIPQGRTDKGCGAGADGAP